LLGYDIKINVRIKPSTITDSPKGLECCNLIRELRVNELIRTILLICRKIRRIIRETRCN